MTFDPHPACVVAPSRAPIPLMTLEERIARIRELGIGQVYVLKFTREIAQLTPEQFVSQFVCGELHARAVIVGANFRFGHKQSGDPAVLEELGRRYGFEIRLVDAVKLRGMVVSTSEIRKRIGAGEVSLAGRLLGRPYAIEGNIVSGHGIGSRQTVPTLNLETPAEVLPLDGVYITRTHDLRDNRRWNSITNIGMRPTFDGHARTIETFLLDPPTGAGPTRMRLEFLRRVRQERRFESPEALKAQILRDAGRAQAFFRRLAKWARRELP
jgi:riboflavin kinase / FMN adenylyltransferase